MTDDDYPRCTLGPSGAGVTKVTVPKHTAQILFDALVHSMDFGSGFLDTEEVDALRDMAVILGVDPATATPDEFVKHYPHAFKPMAVDMIGRAACRSGWPTRSTSRST